MGRVWVGEHVGLNRPVAVKFVIEFLDPSLIQRLEREAELAARVDHPHAVRVFDQGVTGDGVPFLIMELVDGVSLRERLDVGPLPVGEVVTLVSQVASALDAAHASGVIHRDVKPENVLLSTGQDGTTCARLIDFGIAKPLEHGHTLTRVGQLVGTPVYMAPEQLVDVRPAGEHADVWALAVLAYEALTGRRPFEGESLPAVVLSLLLRRFEPVTAWDAGLSSALDTFFDRAFHADPAQRHGSAGELARALARAASGPLGAPGTRAPTSLRLPNRLYGREAELAVLERALDRAVGGPARTVVVGGFSGIGKTSLVLELRRRLRGRSVAVAAGKFDPFDRDRPYQSLIQGFRELIREGLLRRDPGVVTWCRELTTSSASIGGVLDDTLREFEHVIGPVQPSDDGADRARFRIAMSRLIGAFAQATQPLVVFWDDLQWADPASLDLLTALARDPEIRHVLLVCAYRDNEVDGDHPVLPALAQMRASGRVDEIALGPLEGDAVQDLVSDAFPGMQGTRELGAAVYAKTRGNAFFVRRLLENLVERELIWHDGIRWAWNAEGVAALDIPDDVAEVVAAEIARMTPATRQALAVAACIGDRFEVETLAHALNAVGEQPSLVADEPRNDAPAHVLERLRPALAVELLVAGEVASWGGLRLRFAHDRVRQAARAALDDREAARVHRVVGQYLLDHLKGSERDARLFEVVEHLDRGAAELSDEGERAQLRALNLEAARRAIRSAAFEVGARYLRTARNLLDPDAWDHDYAQTFDIHVEGARAAYLAGAHGEMEALVDLTAERAREPLHQVEALEVRIQARLSQQRFHEALATALVALELLGERIGPSPSLEEAGAVVADTLAALGPGSHDRVVSMPVSDDPVAEARRRIHTSAMSSAYMAAPTLLPVLACAIVRSTLEDGLCRYSSYGFAVLGLALIAGGHIEAGYGAGRIAHDLLDRLVDRSTRARTLHVLSAHVMLHVEPLARWVDVHGEVARLGLDAGDLEYAAWGLHCQVCNGFYAGTDLSVLSRTFERNAARLVHHRQEAALGCTLQYGRAIACLRGQSPDPASLSGGGYDEQAQAAAFREANFRGAAYILAAIGAYVRFVFRRLDEAVAFADEGAQFADGAAATYHLVWWDQVRTLAFLGGVEAGTPEARSAAEAVAPQLRQLESRAQASQVNHAHRLHLVQGELARVGGRAEEALEHFASAAEHAREQGFQHEEALAIELEARCHRSVGDRSRALAAGQRAQDTWARWGATEKARHLEAELLGW